MPLPIFHRGPRNRRRDSWVMHHVPVSVLEYPFETALALWGGVSGVQVAFDIVTPSVADLPQPLPLVWALLMLGGGAFVGWGLWRHAYSTYVASGINMIGYVCAAYALAIIAFTEDWRRAATVVGLLVAVSLVAFLRAWWLRARSEVLAGRLGNGAAKDG